MIGAFLEVRGISKSFPSRDGRRQVLRDVSIGVARGEFVAILGAMGSGKSTLLSILAGLTPADTGTITIEGEAVRGVRHDAAFVFQNYSLLPWFTALENVRLAIEAAFPRLALEDQRAKARGAGEGGPWPPATLGAPIEVALPRRRSAAQLARDEQATQVRSHVVASLTAALGMRIARRGSDPAPAAPFVIPPVAEATDDPA